MSRVWDRFLTDRDRETVAMRPPPVFGLGSRAALIVVDNWNTVVGDGPEDIRETLTRSLSHYGVEGWEAVQRTKALLEAARRREMLVIHTTMKDIVPIAGMVRVAGRIGDPSPDWHRDNYPQPGELQIYKSTSSAFMGTSLAAHLVVRNIDTLLVCGNSTSGCVRATVVDASAHGFKVGVVEECVFDRTEASHAINLFDMDQKYADVISFDVALAFIANDAARPR